MFCPKCGKDLLEDAKFCPRCGAGIAECDFDKAPHAIEGQQSGYAVQPSTTLGGGRFAYAGQAGALRRQGAFAAAAPANVQVPNVAKVAARSSSEPVARRTPKATASTSVFTPVGIAARIATVLTVVLMFMPWLRVDVLEELQGYASLLGYDIPAKTSFTMLNVDAVTSTLDLISSSDSYSALHAVFYGFWIAALVLAGAGLVLSFTGRKSTRMLVPGAIAATLVALLWFVAITNLNAHYASQMTQLIGFDTQFFSLPWAVWATAVMGIVTAVLGFAGKRS